MTVDDRQMAIVVETIVELVNERVNARCEQTEVALGDLYAMVSDAAFERMHDGVMAEHYRKFLVDEAVRFGVDVREFARAERAARAAVVAAEVEDGDGGGG